VSEIANRRVDVHDCHSDQLSVTHCYHACSERVGDEAPRDDVGQCEHAGLTDGRARERTATDDTASCDTFVVRSTALFQAGRRSPRNIAVWSKKGKSKGFPYSTPSVGPGADPGVYRQSACRWRLSHPPGGRLPLLSARPAVTSPVAEHHRPLASTKLYCLVAEAHRCEQLA